MKYFNLLLILLPFHLFSQPNCNAFLYNADSLQYKACKLAENVDDRYYQFSREFQETYDKALIICPYFAYGYKEKSVAYLKSGDFITWKKLMDKAVEYAPKDNLGYRAWCRYQFFRDYQGAINDIEKLDSLIDYDPGYYANGDYHLNITKAICYSALNQKTKAIDIIETQLKQKDYQVGLFDYYQLGVTYFEVKNYQLAFICFEKQAGINELAENEYYKCRIYKLQNKQGEYLKCKQLALKLYKENKKLFDPYTHHFNNVYYEMMLKE